ncbi:MAG: hypothetical protein SF029_08610 [bacterium]|nr:hypothetical protein [bacterium]
MPRSFLFLVLFNLYLMVTTFVLFEDGPRYVFSDNGPTPIFPHAAALLTSILALVTLSPFLISVFHQAWRQGQQRRALRHAMRNPGGVKIGSDGEIILEVKAVPLRTEMSEINWWIEVPMMLLQQLVFYTLACCVFYAGYVIFHTPEALLRIILNVIDPTISRFEFERLLAYVYVTLLLVGTGFLVAHLTRQDPRRR